MGSFLILLFWLSVLLIGYTYLGYPFLIGLLSKLRPCPPGPRCLRPQSVSFVIAARDEGERIRQRVQELQHQLTSAQVSGEVILVLDGVLNSEGLGPQLENKHPVRILALSQNAGKSAAISKGFEQATGEIIALADVRQQWADDALTRLLERFQDSNIAAVSGDLMLESAGANVGVGLYWRYEKWIRLQESIFDSVVGVTGAIAAVRRELFRPIPAGTILDDVHWPLQVIMAGHRVVHEPSAKAYDRLPDKTADEFRRKVRTLAGNFQLPSRLPAAFIPWKNRVCWQLISRKMCRLAVPWALLVALAATVGISKPFYQVLFWVQFLGYSGLALCVAWPPANRLRLVSAVLSFVMLNLAAWVAFWVWISGRTAKSWSSTQYSNPHEPEQKMLP